MSDLFPVAGAKIYIGPATATQATDFVIGDFSGIAEGAFVEIDGWETAGGYGDSAEVITTQLINRKRDIKQKGTRNAGTMDNRFAIIPTDPGQIAMLAAEKGVDNFLIRVVYDDMPSGGANGTTDYFVGLITTWKEDNGQANTTRMKQGIIEINSNLVRVNAA